VYPGQIVLTVSDIVDQHVMRRLAASLALPLIGVTTPVQQAVDIVGNADAYVGGRWHPAIFALSGGSPVIALSGKTFKMQALADAAGLSTAVYDAFQVGRDRESIGRTLIAQLEQGGALRRRLKAWADGQAQLSWENVAYLEKWREAKR
jgi:polysaccharide pyruvyl transferase WcaK-like protein